MITIKVCDQKESDLIQEHDHSFPGGLSIIIDMMSITSDILWDLSFILTSRDTAYKTPVFDPADFTGKDIP